LGRNGVLRSEVVEPSLLLKISRLRLQKAYLAQFLVLELAVLAEASELVEDCIFYGELFSIHGNELHNPQFLSDSGLLALLRNWDVYIKSVIILI
jgi:hypothetical protein